MLLNDSPARLWGGAPCRVSALATGEVPAPTPAGIHLFGRFTSCQRGFNRLRQRAALRLVEAAGRAPQDAAPAIDQQNVDIVLAGSVNCPHQPRRANIQRNRTFTRFGVGDACPHALVDESTQARRQLIDGQICISSSLLNSTGRTLPQLEVRPSAHPVSTLPASRWVRATCRAASYLIGVISGKRRWPRRRAPPWQIITGSRCVRWRITSNDRLAEPTTIAARNSVAGTVRQSPKLSSSSTNCSRQFVHGPLSYRPNSTVAHSGVGLASKTRRASWPRQW